MDDYYWLRQAFFHSSTTLLLVIANFSAALFQIQEGSVYLTAMWPPAGITLCLAWLYGRRVYPAFYLSSVGCAMIINPLTVTYPIPFVNNLISAMIEGFAPIAAAGVTWTLYRHYVTSNSNQLITCAKDVIVLTLSISAGLFAAYPLLVATFIVIGFSTPDLWIVAVNNAIASSNSFLPCLISSAILFTTLLASWLDPEQKARWTIQNVIELTLTWFINLIVCWVFFSGQFPYEILNRHPVFILPWMLWIACRYTNRYSLPLNIFISFCVILSGVHETIPFEFGSVQDSLIYTMFFVTLSCLGTLLISTYRFQTKKKTLALAHFNQELKNKVIQRTQKLQKTIDETQKLLADQKLRQYHIKLINEAAEQTNQIDNIDHLTVKIGKTINNLFPDYNLTVIKDHQIIHGESTQWKDSCPADDIKCHHCTLIVPVIFQEKHYYHYLFDSHHKVELNKITHGTIIRIRNHLLQVIQRQQKTEESAILNQKLMEASRKAGMADVATNVMQTIGHALTHLHQSTEATRQYINQLDFSELRRQFDVLYDYRFALSDYLYQPEGMATIQKINQHNKKSKTIQATIQQELKEGLSNLDEVNKLVTLQQKYAKNSTVQGTITIAKLLQDIDDLYKTVLENKNIKLNIEHLNQSDKLKVNLDIHIVLQIVTQVLDINISNLNNIHFPQILITTDFNHAVLSICLYDNGISDMTDQGKIFLHPSLDDTNGINLHQSANLASSMNGQLSIANDIPSEYYQGYTFSVKTSLKIDD